MTFPVGTKVKINPDCKYARQGIDFRGNVVVGVVVDVEGSPTYQRNWANMGWDVKVDWPHKDFNVYNSQAHLIPAKTNTTFKDLL